MQIIKKQNSTFAYSSFPEYEQQLSFFVSFLLLLLLPEFKMNIFS